jgi:drug/metabolite transporter (DMT)-like permease
LALPLLARIRALPQGVRYMLISTLSFSLMNACVKGLVAIPAYEIIFFRVAISFTIAFSALRAAHIPIFGNNRKWLLIRGASGALALWLYFITIKLLPLPVAVAIQYTSPIFGALLAPFFVREHLTARQWAYFMVSFAGVAALAQFETALNWKATLLGLTSAFLTGLTINSIRKSRSTEHPLVVLIYLPLFALPFSGIYTVTNFILPRGTEWLLLIGTGIFTHFNQYYTTKALQADTIARVTYMNYLGLIYAVILGFFLFGEKISLGTIGALCLIASGVLLNLVYNFNQTRKIRNLPSIEEAANV